MNIISAIKNRVLKKILTPEDEKILRLSRASSGERPAWLLRHFEENWGGRESSTQRVPVGGQGEPLAWYTYAAIAWIKQLDLSNCSVFEFGSGNSSLFWSARAKTVRSVESSPEWHAKISPNLKANQALLLKTDIQEYVGSISEENTEYDVVIVDGLYRFDCAKIGRTKVKTGGCLILDNSDWHPNTCEMLRASGFTQIDFIGPGPLNAYSWSTSIFISGTFSLPRRQTGNSVEVLDGIIQISKYDQSTLGSDSVSGENV